MSFACWEMKTQVLEALRQKLKVAYYSLFDGLPKQFSLIDKLRLLASQKISSRFLSKINGYVLLALVVMICVSLGLGVIVGPQSAFNIINSRGNVIIEGVGVYKDWTCNTAVSFLDWGTLEPGSARNITVYIRNEGNHVATLFMAADNWNPTNASSYMSLSWNYDGKMFSPMDAVEVTLTLSVSPTVENIADFSFDIIIGING